MQRETPFGVSRCAFRGCAWPDRRTYRRPSAAARSRSGRTCGCRHIVALQAQRRFFFHHLQMAAEEFAPFFLIPEDVDAGVECADGAGVGISAPMRAASLAVSVFQAGHELAADFRVLREQVTEMSSRARVIFGGSFAQQRQKGMQFCAGCAIINAVIQQEGSLCESLSKSELPHWRTRPGAEHSAYGTAVQSTQ